MTKFVSSQLKTLTYWDDASYEDISHVKEFTRTLVGFEFADIIPANCSRNIRLIGFFTLDDDEKIRDDIFMTVFAKSGNWRVESGSAHDALKK